MMTRLRALIQRNLPAKIIALVVAVVLWLFVMNEQNPQIEGSFTVAVDLVGMALAAAGILTPVLAAIVHVGSETAFILNSARLIPGKTMRRRTRLGKRSGGAEA